MSHTNKAGGAIWVKSIGVKTWRKVAEDGYAWYIILKEALVKLWTTGL
jgi:hypothetical protein